MLLEYLVDYCFQDYNQYGCFPCNHPSGCPHLQYCKDCLEEIHYPGRHPNGRRNYDCQRLRDFYVCDYSFKYASEYLHMLNATHALDSLRRYYIISIGCGPCTDLIAFEKYNYEMGQDKKIRYLGVDLNEGWSKIHNEISHYCESEAEQDIKTGFFYDDTSRLPDDINLSKVNILSLQYVVSSIFQSGGATAVQSFFTTLVQKIVLKRNPNKPFIIFINDVNSNNMGRDCFVFIHNVLRQYNIRSVGQAWYFNRNISNVAQMYGSQHISVCGSGERKFL